MHPLRVASLGIFLTLVAPMAAHAQQAPNCQFTMGFAAFHTTDPGVVGDCLDDQRYAVNGDATQDTTKGLLVWRKADNWTAFTNGSTTWLNGPFGLVTRSNTQRFPWESDYGAAGTSALAPPLKANGQAWTIYFDRNLLLPSVQVDDGSGHLTPLPAKGKWVDIYFWARDNQPRPARLTVDDVSLADKQGRHYSSAFDLRQVTAPGVEAPFTAPVPPGATVLLRITLDVAKDASGGVLRVAGGNDIAAL